MPVMNWAYIAGFFDGEGSVVIRANNTLWNLGATVSMVQAGAQGKVLLEEIKDFIEKHGIVCNRIYSKRHSRMSGHHKELFELRITAREAIIGFASRVLPYVTIKRTGLQDVLRYYVIFQLNPLATAEKQRRIAERGREAMRKIHASGVGRKLTREQVIEIRRRASSGEKQVRLAEEFGVCFGTISDVVNRRNWNSV